ncbi:MAG: right-handed parallel beta-helix repeat-containing protein, partial [Bacteroidales bacterium]|nr:right-handed parallel beta-helix repeat-containing protein [Bacteroidales bacterium]
MEKMRTLILSMVIILTGVWSLSAQTLPKSDLPTSGTWGKFAGVVDGSGEVKLTGDISMVGVIRIDKGQILKITVDTDKATKNNITISNIGIGVWVDGNQSAGTYGRSRMFTVKGKSANGEYGRLIIEAPEGYTITLDGGSGTNGRTLSEAIANEGILELKNVVIQNVDGQYSGGGAILTYDKAASTTVENCTFTNCHTIEKGGAISVETAATTTLTGCTFENCTSGSVGGGIYITSSAPTTITDCAISGCSANSNGGGIYLSKSSEVTMDGCTISG